MNDSGSDDESVKLIDLKFKTITDTYELKVKENAKILKLKKLLAEKVEQSVEKVCLIFSGKILKEHETISQHHIGDGMVIHMVIRNQAKPSQSRESTPSSATSSISGQAPPSAIGVGGGGGPIPAASSVPPPQTAAAGGAIPPSLFGGMGNLFNNPELVQGILNSPLMESLMNSPEMIRTMLTENPQIQQVMQNNPELGHILNDPGIMRQTLDMMRNPSAFNELMRNHDQAIRNLQGIPGGEAALHRLYEQVQEPLLNSVLGTPGDGNQAANANGAQNTTSNTGGSSRSQHAGVENAEALPNPWSRVVNQQQNHGTGEGGGGGGVSSGTLPFANIMNTPGIQSLFQQISSNPAAMQSLINPENMRRFSQLIGNNPAMFQQIAQSIPGFDNPELSEQLRNNMPQLNSLMTNPQIMQSITNPRVLSALQQIQQATQVLRQEAPQLFGNLPGSELFQGVGSIAGLSSLLGGLSTAATGERQQNAAATGEGGAEAAGEQVEGGGMAEQAQTPPANIPAGFAELLGSLMNMSTANSSQQQPEERFRAQLEQLTAMGFTDQQANIQALLASFGDVSMAIERLLSAGANGGNLGAQQ